jgi:hypothetical protein
MPRSSLVLALLALLAASPLVLAGQPPRTLEAELVTDGSTPGVQSLGSSDSAQPVNVMNWLLDENGNLKVSMQVRDELHRFATPAAPLQLGYRETWQSEWVDARRFNVVRLSIQGLRSWTYYVTTWGDGHEDMITLENGGVTAATAFGVMGPQVAIRLICSFPEGCTITEASMYLRAE